MSYRDSFDRQAYAKGVEKGKSLIDESALTTIAELLSKPRSNVIVKLTENIAVNASFVVRVQKEEGCCFIYMQDGKYVQVKPVDGVTLEELFEATIEQLQF